MNSCIPDKSELAGVDRAGLIENQVEALNLRLQIMNEAKETILISSFSYKVDQSCREFFAVVLAAAERGVKVKIIGDGLMCLLDMKDHPMYYALMSHNNIEISFFNAASLLNLRNLNCRLHDKYVIVDDRLLILGGRNTSDYFLSDYNPSSLSYDRDVLIYNTTAKGNTTVQGNTTVKGNANVKENTTAQRNSTAQQKRSKKSVIAKTIQYFYSVWNHAGCNNVFNETPFWKRRRLENMRTMLTQTYKSLLKDRPELFTGDSDYTKITVPAGKISLIYNPIDPLDRRPHVWKHMVLLMKKAKIRVYIQTPYTVLSRYMFKDLKAVSRRVNTEILTNSLASGANYFAMADYVCNRSAIQKYGITFHEYQGNCSLHHKSVLIDSHISIIGSFNMDIRSAYINTETMLVIYSQQFNVELEQAMKKFEAKALTVGKDGRYIEKAGTTPHPFSQGRGLIIKLSGILVRPFRFLI